MTTEPPARLLADPSFRLLWVGEALASVSEQLFVVCLTLLVLDLAGPGAALGAVLAVAAVPRAVLLPFGGLLADRVDPVRILVAATWVRAAVLGSLVLVVLTGALSLPAVAGLGALLGLLDAVYFPASLAVLPAVVRGPDLPRANALVQGAESAGDLFGPALAAGLVAVLGIGGGLGGVAALYLVAAVVLTAFARRWTRRSAGPVEPAGPPPRALLDGFRYAWGQPAVRVMLVVLAVLNVAVVGPLLVGGSVVAVQRLGGPGALATVFAGFGAGSLLGLLAAGLRVPLRRGLVLVTGTAVIGAGVAGFGWVHTLPAALALAAVIGLAEAYLGVVLVAWLQELVPDHLRGRVMSLVVLAVVALDPLSYALAGVLLPAGIPVLFAACGGLVVLCAAGAATAPAVRSLR